MHGYTAADRPSGTMNTGPSAWNIICKEKSGTCAPERVCLPGIRVEQYREIGGRTSYEEETAPALSYSGRQVAGLDRKTAAAVRDAHGAAGGRG